MIDCIIPETVPELWIDCGLDILTLYWKSSSSSSSSSSSNMYKLILRGLSLEAILAIQCANHRLFL
jgi:hypothetical protein